MIPQADCEAFLNRRPVRSWPFFLLVAWIGFPALVFGHPEGFSGMHITATSGQLRAAITLHTRDLGAWFPPGQYPDYVADVCRAMEQTIGEIVELQIDGEPLPVAKVRAFLLEVGLIEIDVDYAWPKSQETVELLVWSKHLLLMPRDHRQLLFVEDRRTRADDAEQRQLLLEDVLTSERDAGAVLLPPGKTASSFPSQSPVADSSMPPTEADRKDANTESNASVRKPKLNTDAPARISFFLFGVEHILTGYDHLLFLAALLLTCTRFKEAAVIITCFTVAHSFTLALAALDVVRLPGEIVEPVIALSIVYVAIENLFGTPVLWRRAGITCLFGLMHGLGFASALRDIGLGTIPGGVLWPLVKFNLGVEAGQLAVTAVLFPGLLLARRSERLAKWVPLVGSILVALIGGYWFVTRVMAQFGVG